MNGPIHSGGGRRQHSSKGWTRLKFAGRAVLALSAGAAFGALAWEPVSDATSTSENERIAAELRRDNNAGQDERRPSFDVVNEPVASGGDALLSPERRNHPSWVARGAETDDAADHSGRVTQTRQDHVDVANATSGVRSRAPPY